MPNDLYMSTSGDLAISSTGDIAMTENPWQCDAQQAFLRAMTDIGDFLLYPTLGANLGTMYGMPQSQATGDYGIALLQSALSRESYFASSQIQISAVPISSQTIRFDIYITSTNNQQFTISLQQNLGIAT